MRHRKGYDGPQQYRRDARLCGGRRNSGGLSEIERFIHLMPNMFMVNGARRGGLLMLLLLVALIVGGWTAYRYAYSPERAVETAHQLWDSNETQQQMQAIEQYRDLLQKTDPLDPARLWVRDDRDTLYRRVIIYEFKYEKNRTKAAEWILRAWDEGIRDLRISASEDPDVKAFWDQTVEPLKRKNRIKDKNRNGTFNTVP